MNVTVWSAIAKVYQYCSMAFMCGSSRAKIEIRIMSVEEEPSI